MHMQQLLMKFKWKIMAFAFTCFICILWFIGTEQRNSVELSPEEEIASLKQQLKQALEYRAKFNNPNVPVIYIITPTYTRLVQKAELTRLSQTFRLVPNLHWIVVEDSPSKTPLVSNLLKRSTLNYTHLDAETPPKWKFVGNKPTWKKPRGVLQRNTAIDWIREHLSAKDKGVIYFADDDNTYDIQVFEEMRYTRTVSVWPVGLVGAQMVEKCIVDASGRVTGWNSAWKPDRLFPLDMAAFAINLQLFLSKPQARFSFDVEGGYQESALLRYLAKRDEFEAKADNCTKVYVWHTRTETPSLKSEREVQKLGFEKTHKDIEV